MTELKLEWLVYNLGAVSLEILISLGCLIGIIYCAYKLGETNERIDNLLKQRDKDV